MSPFTSTRGLLIEELKSLFSAETQLTRLLPKMANAATDEELREALETQADEAHRQAKRLEKILHKLHDSASNLPCEAVKALALETEALIRRKGTPVIKDLALIGAAQKVAHYKLAGYNAARALAELSGETDTTDALQDSLDEGDISGDVLHEIACAIEVPFGEQTESDHPELSLPSKTS